MERYMEIRLDNQIMLQSLRHRWEHMDPDVRVTLDSAWRLAIRKPHLVPEIDVRYRVINGIQIEFNKFRIGYAVFHLALISDLPIVHVDFGLYDKVSQFVTDWHVN